MTQSAQKSHCDQRRPHGGSCGHWLGFCAGAQALKAVSLSCAGPCLPRKSSPRCHGAQDRPVGWSIDNTQERQPHANPGLDEDTGSWAAREKRAGRQGPGCGPSGRCTENRWAGLPHCQREETPPVLATARQ
uniref:Uncharacterized protein n=1 Tax=Molossus molossus TaxID=27622 RepID=A0A7J8EF99_MOLMO|nr:hypothetical protein HJG59_008832 [Molossus molossus]